MFHIRTIHLAEKRQDQAAYELAPTNPEGQQVCAMFAGFLAERPPEFRERLPFLRRDLELEWTAAPGGVALASFHTGQAPCSMGILLAGVDAEADRIMLDAWRDNVIGPLMGGDAGDYGLAAERPLLINVLFPEAAEFGSALELMAAALASVYFRNALARKPTDSPTPAA